VKHAVTVDLSRAFGRPVSFCGVPRKAGGRLVRFDDPTAVTPAHHQHVESPFSAVRLRTDAARRFKKTDNAEAMIWKLLCVAEKSWRKLNAPQLMKEVYDGKRFKDGVALPTPSAPMRKAA
jgi:hypothetical protein